MSIAALASCHWRETWPRQPWPLNQFLCCGTLCCGKCHRQSLNLGRCTRNVLRHNTAALRRICAALWTPGSCAGCGLSYHRAVLCRTRLYCGALRCLQHSMLSKRMLCNVVFCLLQTFRDQLSHTWQGCTVSNRHNPAANLQWVHVE